jgi:KaiC/GvpD/RAD55 family RecA-like ATPase
MLKLNRAWGMANTKATPLPEVWKALTTKSIRFRRGQVCMIAAAPNAGKSMFALSYAIKAKVPTLFFSADTDTSTIMMRAAAAVSQHTQAVVEECLNKNPNHYDEDLSQIQNIEWVFDSSPSMDDIELEIKAYVELYGQSPELIVIDNLMNVVTDSENEWAALRSIMVELHDMARKTEACVLVLHHVSEASEYGSPTKPPPRRAIHGKVSQLPSLILTLGYDPLESILRVAAVKNRFGGHNADGSDNISLFVNYASCQINDADAQGRAYRRDAIIHNYTKDPEDDYQSRYSSHSW